MKNVIVAYDGSGSAKRALERTAEVANGAAVTVVSAVHVVPNIRAAAATDPEEVAAREQELGDAAEFLRGKGIKPQTVEAHGLSVGDAILEQAQSAGADLIIVGTSGKSLAERFVLGSVSTKIVHEAPCDVLVVR